jgi:hypothetical protein
LGSSDSNKRFPWVNSKFRKNSLIKKSVRLPIPVSVKNDLKVRFKFAKEARKGRPISYKDLVFKNRSLKKIKMKKCE